MEDPFNDDAERANIQFVKIKDDHDDFDGSVWENTWILDSILFKFDIMPSKDMEIIDDDAERANIQFVKIKDDHDDDDGSVWENKWILDAILFALSRHGDHWRRCWKSEHPVCEDQR